MKTPTPLYKKLNLKENSLILPINQPADYWNFYDQLPEGLELLELEEASSVGWIHLFCSTHEELNQANKLVPLLMKDGCLWVSWPKASGSLPTSINQSDVRAFVLKLGLVDCKVASINENWSAIKFMFRKADR